MCVETAKINQKQDDSRGASSVILMVFFVDEGAKFPISFR